MPTESLNLTDRVVSSFQRASDALRSLWSIPDPQGEEAVVRQESDRIEAEILTGPWADPTPEEIQKLREYKPVLEQRVREQLASQYVSARLQELEEAASERGQKAPVVRTEKGEVIITPQPPQRSKEYFKAREQIAEFARNVSAGTVGVDPNALRKLLLTLNTELELTPRDLEEFQTSITLDLVHGIKQRDIIEFKDLTELDPRILRSKKDILALRNAVEQSVEKSVAENWKPDNLRKIVPESFDNILSWEPKAGARRLVRRTRQIPVAGTRLETLLEAQRPDELEINPNVGDTFWDILKDSTKYALGAMYDTFKDKKPPAPKAFKRLENLYGKNWPTALAVWAYTDLIVPTMGAVKARQFVQSLPGASKWFGTKAIENASRLGAAWRSFVVGLAEGVAWTASEKAVAAPIEYWESGKDADYLQNLKADFAISVLAFGGFNGLGTILNKEWQKQLQKWGLKKLRKRVETFGDFRNLSNSERMALESIGGNKALEALRAMQIQDFEKNIAQQTFYKVEGHNPFDLVFKVAGDTKGLEGGLVNQLAHDLSVSAGGFGDYLAKKKLEQLDNFTVLLKNNRYMDDVDEAIIDNIFEDTSQNALWDNWVEGIFTFGGWGASQGRISGQVRLLNDNFSSPLRRQSTRIKQSVESAFKRALNSPEDKQQLLQAMGYSDQYGRLLDRAELKSKIFSLSDAAIQSYYKLHTLFRKMWEDLNRLEGDELSRRGFKVLLDSNLDGQGQKLVLRELNINKELLENATPYRQKEILEALPKSLKQRIENGLNNNEFSFKSIVEELRLDKLKAYEEYHVGRGVGGGARFARPEQVADAKGQSVIGYNPGFFGGVRYKRAPVRVVAIHPKSFMETTEAGAVTRNNPVINAYATRHVADAQAFISNSKLAQRLRKKGYNFAVVREGQSVNDVFASFDAMLPGELGRFPTHKAEAFAKELGTRMGWSDEQVASVMTAITRPSLSPWLQDRKGYLRGRLWRWTPDPDTGLYQQKGRMVWTKDGQQKLRNDLLPVLSTEEAGLEYIRRYASTLGKGEFRSVLKRKFAERYGKFLVDASNPFGDLVIPHGASAYAFREFAHAKATQHLLEKLYAYPTKTESIARRLLETAADSTAVRAENNFIANVGSRMLDELAIPKHLSTRLKTLGTMLIFMGNTGIALVQLMPAFYSTVTYKKFPWVERMISQPLKKSKIAPVRWLGTTTEIANVNPAETIGMLKDALTLAADTSRRLMPKQTKPLFTKGRNKHLTDDLFESGYLSEIRSIEDAGDIRGKPADAAMIFFFGGEGTAKLFTFAAARRAMEGEFNFALRQARKGKALDQELSQWSRWFSIQKDGELKLTKEGQLEAQRRATALNLNFSSEDAPWASQGTLGVFTQYVSTLAAQISDKYIFGNALSTGDKLRMHLLAASVFGYQAIPFAEDVLGSVLQLQQAIKGKLFPKQTEELTSEFIDMTGGYIDNMFGMPIGSTSRAIRGGTTGMTSEQQINIANKLFVSALITDFLEGNINKASIVFSLLSKDMPIEAVQQATRLTPSTQVIMGQYKSLEDAVAVLRPLLNDALNNVDPIKAIQLIYGLQEFIGPQGMQGEFKAAWKDGNDDVKVVEAMDNVRRQLVRNAPGVARWSAFLDTFGANFAGQEYWQTPRGRSVDVDDPWSTRIELLTGIGPAAAQDAWIMRDLRKDREAQARLIGVKIGKHFAEGRVEAGQALLNQAIEEAANDPQAIMYLEEVFDSWIFHGLTKPYITPKTEKTLEEAQSPGVSPSVSRPMTEQEWKNIYGRQ